MSLLKIVSTTNMSQAPNVTPLIVSHLSMGHEHDNELVQYYIYDSFAGDKASTYPVGTWGKPGTRLTRKEIQDMGIKSFPRLGAFGFFKYKYNGKSAIMVPINIEQVLYTAPVLAMTVVDNDITFTITPPTDVTYECYRITLRCDYFALEYITYRETLTVSIPSVKGTYEIVCVGYVSEGRSASYDSNELSLIVTTGLESFIPMSDGAVVASYKANKSTTVSATMLSTSWVGSVAPYTLTLNVNGVTTSNIVEVVPSPSITTTQVLVMQSAQILTGTQSEDSITLMAFGTKPTIDLPIIAIVRGD